ncbi:LacI family DNA-binding transcriptional regulator [Streptococcus cameli]
MRDVEKTITMKDVARLAGVGVGTVSRVVNGIKVKESTLEKVQAAIEELNYQPDEYARGLKTNRSHTIALIIPSIWHPFFSEFAYYVEKNLSDRNYKMFICNIESDVSTEIEYLEMVKNNKVDGIIGITYSDIDQYVSSNLPFVSIDRHFSEDVPYVSSDNFGGGQLAAKELLARGVSHFAYIGGKNIYENETDLRKKGFYQVVEEAKKPLYKLDLLEPIENLEDKIQDFLLEHAQIDGIFAVNDFMAMRIIRVLKEMGKKVPEDIQVVGFDGLKPAIDQDYFLSTIRQPLELLAKTSVETLLTLLSGEEPSPRTVLPVTFVAAGTTK